MENIPIKYRIFIFKKLRQYDLAYFKKITINIFLKQSHFRLKTTKKSNIIHQIQKIEIITSKVEILGTNKPFQALKKLMK